MCSGRKRFSASVIALAAFIMLVPLESSLAWGRGSFSTRFPRFERPTYDRGNFLPTRPTVPEEPVTEPEEPEEETPVEPTVPEEETPAPEDPVEEPEEALVSDSETESDSDETTETENSAEEPTTEPEPTPAPEPVALPVVSLSVEPDTVTKGGVVILTWFSTDATVCAASGDWTLSTETSGTASVAPSGTTTYSMTCTGEGGPTEESVTVTVTEPEPEPTPEPEPVPEPVAGNLVPNPSLETGSGDTPSGWSKNSWGTLSASFTYPVAGHAGERAAEVSVTSYSDGDAKWYFDDVAVTPGAEYLFSDRYKASVPTEVTARYAMSDGSESYVWLGSVQPADSWARYSVSFTVPAGAVSMTVFHLIAAKGTLTVDDYSLAGHSSSFSEGMVSFTFDDGFLSAYEALPILEEAGIRSTQAIITGTLGWDGYVSADQVRDMAARGHEIASHTRTHAHLTTLSGAELASEVVGSRDDLAALGITAESFVYPYGEYDAGVVDAVISAGYSAARSVDEGHNSSTADPYLIRDRHITSEVTFTTVRGWIDEAIANRQWLVFEMHEQDENGGQYSNDPELLREIAAYVRSAGVRTVTLGEGFSMLER